MPLPNILLLDFAQPRDLGNTLYGILESAYASRIRLQHMFVHPTEPLDSAYGFADLVARGRPDLVCLVMSFEALRHARAWRPKLRRAVRGVPLVLVVEEGEPEEISAWLEEGAAVDFITPPLRALDIVPRVRHLLDNPHGDTSLTYKLKKAIGLKQIVGNSQAICNVVKKLGLAAQSDACVLITGETGTGKELCARAIHYLSHRAPQPFVPVNCGAIPSELVENELFGHVRGAFTGASNSQPGLIREADKGTLLLDEIDCLPLLAQVKLLRFLQEKEYRSLGSSKTLQADVRIIAAANSDSAENVRSGKLRQDFFYRLNVIPLQLPSLRERREDIQLLANHFLARYAAEFRKPVKYISEEALGKLRAYDWPGNVRELENLITRAVVLTEGEAITKNDLDLPGGQSPRVSSSFREAKSHFERDYVENLLSTHDGNITKAAQAAHKNRRAFWELMRKYHIDAASFKVGHGP